jgi:hypothetical protein
MDIQSFDYMKIIQNCKSSKPTTISIIRHNSENKEEVSIWERYRRILANSRLTIM